MLFDPQSERLVVAALREAKKNAREYLQQRYDLAIDYLENRQLEDTRALLFDRYQATQDGAPGQIIEPITIPLTSRFLDEMATLYSNTVTRKLVDESGDENEQATKDLNKLLADCGFDETMHSVERKVLLLGSCGLWLQVKRGQLRPVVALPQSVYPVANPDHAWADDGDQDDYLGFAVEMAHGVDDMGLVSQRKFALLLRESTRFYAGRSPFEPTNEATSYPNPYTWPQVVDTEDHRGQLVDGPLQMLVMAHRNKPDGCLITDTDCDIVTINRELNLQWSILLDTMRIQGWDVPVITSLNPEAINPRIKHGSRFAVALQVGESYQRVGTATPFQAMIDVLKQFVRLAAVAHALSPNDVSIDGAAALSGFAKLIDSLPKLDARKRLAERMKYTEEILCWPRIGAAMRYLGLGGAGLEKLKMSVQFADVEMPLSVGEQVQRDEFDIKHGLTSPAKLLAKRTGITTEQAEAEVAENMVGKPPVTEPKAPAEKPREERQASLLGRLIGKPSSQR